MMRGHFVKGLTTGLLFGAAASIMMLPQMDNRSRKKLNKTTRKFAHKTGDFLSDLWDRSR